MQDQQQERRKAWAFGVLGSFCCLNRLKETGWQAQRPCRARGVLGVGFDKALRLPGVPAPGAGAMDLRLAVRLFCAPEVV
ncbi:hypothetical protein [Roseibium polysiphoniae]|uniref:hypothetical protein n=1 Tax=Roseibium polysiphoniae TaxID=2571221 RepID=UPI0025930C0F|nr:hypothetical protein [uncultured Roseibium sp.]